MLVFSTQSSLHLVKRVAKQHGFVLGKWESYQFSDGELYVRIKNNVRGQKVLVIGSTEAPAENLIELLFLVRAVQENGGFPRIVITYLGYARANRVENSGEPHRLRLVAETLSETGCPTSIIDIHNEKSMSLFNGAVTASSAMHTLCRRVKKYLRGQDCIVIAPDYGARKRASHAAVSLGIKKVVVLKKKRDGAVVQIAKPRTSFENKTVIIVDDIFDTGSTLLRAAEIAKDLGARHVYGLVAHGVFSGNAHIGILKSSIDKLFVTNSLRPRMKNKKVEYVDISQIITKYELVTNIRK